MAFCHSLMWLFVTVISVTTASSLILLERRNSGGDLLPSSTSLSSSSSSTSSSSSSSPSSPSSSSCGQNCQTMYVDNNGRMFRCLKFACRKQIFRYYMRIGKRNTEKEPNINRLENSNTVDDDFVYDELTQRQQQQQQQQRQQRHQVYEISNLRNVQKQRKNLQMLMHLLKQRERRLIDKDSTLRTMKKLILQVLNRPVPARFIEESPSAGFELVQEPGYKLVNEPRYKLVKEPGSLEPEDVEYENSQAPLPDVELYD